MARSDRARLAGAIALLGMTVCAGSAPRRAGAAAPLVAAYAARLDAPPLSPGESALARARIAQHEGLALDPALCLAAAAHAAQFQDGAGPDTFADGKGSVRYWLDAAGVSTTLVSAGCAQVEADAGAQAILEALRPKLSVAGMTSLGVGSSQAKRERVFTAIVAARRVVLEPVPLLPQPNETYRLVATLRPPLQGCRIWLTSPDGQTSLVAEAQGRELDGELRFGDSVGRYVVEVVGQTDGGLALTDVLRLHVGEPYPKPFAQAPAPAPPRPLPTAKKAPPEPTTPEEMADALLAEINRLRVQRAIMPLARHEKLMQIAGYNSQDLRRRKAAKPDSILAKIYVKSQVRCKAYSAAVFVGPKPPSASRIKLARNRIFTHIGIGIVKGDLHGREVLWVTIIFIGK